MGGRGGERTVAKEAEGWNRIRENPLGPTRTLSTLRAAEGLDNGRCKRRHKQSHSAGVQGPRGALGSRLRATRKIIAGTVGGGQQEGAMSRCTVDPRLQ